MFAAVAATWPRARARLSAMAAATFIAVVVGNLALILLFRSAGSLWQALRRPNLAYWIVLAAAISALALALLHPAVARWFGFAPPSAPVLAAAIGLPLLVVVVLDLLRMSRRRA